MALMVQTCGRGVNGRPVHYELLETAGGGGGGGRGVSPCTKY